MSISYARRVGQSLTKFQESMVAKREQQESSFNEEKERLYENSFGFKRTPKKSIQKLKRSTHSLREAVSETLLDIIQEACPADGIRDVPRDQLREAIDEVLVLHKGNIVADDGTINLGINQGGANPKSASNLIGKCAALRLDGGSSIDVQANSKDFGVTMAYNNIDTLGAVGADETSANGGSDEFTEKSLAANGVYRSLTATVSNAIRKRVLGNYQATLDELQNSTIVTEADETFGLSEAAKTVRRRKLLREGTQINPVKEIFRSIRILSEGAEHVTHENLLKETLFHMTVLEAYNACGLLEMADMHKFVQNLRSNTSEKAHTAP